MIQFVIGAIIGALAIVALEALVVYLVLIRDKRKLNKEG